MEESFWQERWQDGRIGFHEGHTNRLLETHFSALNMVPGDTIFVPLCGKSLDLDWFLGHGLKVIGVEFNQSAVEEVFQRVQLRPEITEFGGLRRYQNGDLTVFVGDFFALTPEMVGPVTAVYDRAALVAIAPQDRVRYARHVGDVSGGARQLVISFDYDQSVMQGPPFSVPGSVVQKLYGEIYDLSVLETRNLTGPMAERSKGGVEDILLLTRP